MTDRRCGVGKSCTWHGFLSNAEPRLRSVDLAIAYWVCPVCKCELNELTLDEWNSRVEAAESAVPGSRAFAAWSEGRCFPDSDVADNAYRQAAEE